MNQFSASVAWAQPDDCWQKACQIIAKGGYACAGRDGELVQRAVRCVRQLERARTDRAVRRTAMEYPDIYWALRLLQEDSSRVLEMKARVLAGQPDQAIARQLGLPRRTVTTFLAMFFEVRPRLKAASWIRWVAIGLPLDQGPSVETLMLLSSWKNGPSVIPAWMDYLKHQGEHHDLSTDLGRQRAWIEHLIRVHQLPFEAQCLRSLWRLSPYFLAKMPDVTQSTTIRTTISQIRSRILGEITWNEVDEQELSETRIPPAHDEVIVAGKVGSFAQAG